MVGLGGLIGFFPQWWECANQRVKSQMLRGYRKEVSMAIGVDGGVYGCLTVSEQGLCPGSTLPALLRVAMTLRFSLPNPVARVKDQTCLRGSE